MTPREKVKQWMQQFGQSTPDKPEIPSLEIRKLRAKLILEEALETVIYGLGIDEVYTGGVNGDCYAFDELLQCIKSGELDSFREPNLEAIADGCADLRVVTYGTEIACGIPAKECFDEVMRSNASKMWTTEEVAELTSFWVETLRDQVPIGKGVSGANYEAKRIADDARCWLVKDSAGKVVKSPSYSPANLKPILEK